MPDITVDVEVFCAKCGSGLCRDTSVEYSIHNIPYLRVAPCEACIEQSRQDGYDDGYTEGEAKGGEA